MHKATIDITGMKLGYLTVERYTDERRSSIASVMRSARVSYAKKEIV